MSIGRVKRDRGARRDPLLGKVFLGVADDVGGGARPPRDHHWPGACARACIAERSLAVTDVVRRKRVGAQVGRPFEARAEPHPTARRYVEGRSCLGEACDCVGSSELGRRFVQRLHPGSPKRAVTTALRAFFSRCSERDVLFQGSVGGAAFAENGIRRSASPHWASLQVSPDEWEPSCGQERIRRSRGRSSEASAEVLGWVRRFQEWRTPRSESRLPRSAQPAVICCAQWCGRLSCHPTTPMTPTAKAVPAKTNEFARCAANRLARRHEGSRRIDQERRRASSRGRAQRPSPSLANEPAPASTPSDGIDGGGWDFASPNARTERFEYRCRTVAPSRMSFGLRSRGRESIGSDETEDIGGSLGTSLSRGRISPLVASRICPRGSRRKRAADSTGTHRAPRRVPDIGAVIDETLHQILGRGRACR